MTKNDYERLCMTMTIYDCVWVCMTMYDYVWLSMTKYYYVGLCITMFDYVWLFMTMCYYVCLCTTIYENVWICTKTLLYFCKPFQPIKISQKIRFFHMIQMFSHLSTKLDIVYLCLPLLKWRIYAQILCLLKFIWLLRWNWESRAFSFSILLKFKA